MKERPVIFNGEMVRAILDGRKTQTRRVVNPQPTLSERTGFNWKGAAYGIGSTYRDTVRNFANCFKTCPFGQVGDRLWVREAFARGLCTETTLAYRATHKREDLEEGWNETIKWTPSIHMPREACRILLEITAVRVERLQDIRNSDAVAEGVEPLHGGYWRHYQPGWTQHQISARGSFVTLWKSIYAEESWNANPWVWAIEFRRVEVRDARK